MLPDSDDDIEVDGDLPRIKLPCFSTLSHVVNAIKKSKKIIVITGAGISVSSGIPDFRSKDIGLYNTLDCELYNIPSAELLFDYEFFRIDAEPFYKFAGKLVPDDNLKPSPCHKFIASLEARGKLLRNYTQNVDGLERKAGISRVIECHGSMMQFRCMDCKRKSKLEELKKEIAFGRVVYCRSPSCGGILKPDITFFGEELPEPFFKAIKQDVSKCDLVLVIGTSLKVGGSVHLLLKHVEDHVPQVLINREAVVPPPHVSGGFDVTLLGECDQVTRYLTDCLQWTSLSTSSVNMTESNESQGNRRRSAGVCQSDIAANDIKQAFIATKALDKSSSSISRKAKKVLPNKPFDPSQNNEGALATGLDSWTCLETSEREFRISPAVKTETPASAGRDGEAKFLPDPEGGLGTNNIAIPCTADTAKKRRIAQKKGAATTHTRQDCYATKPIVPVRQGHPSDISMSPLVCSSSSSCIRGGAATRRSRSSIACPDMNNGSIMSHGTRAVPKALEVPLVVSADKCHFEHVDVSGDARLSVTTNGVVEKRKRGRPRKKPV